MRRIVAVCVALVPAGCTLLSGVADLEAVSASDAEPALADATRSDGMVTPIGPGTDGAPAETGGETGVPPDPLDAGTDARSDADATTGTPDTGAPDVVVTPPAFCATQPSSVDLCFDYDSVSIPPGATQVHSNATLSIDAPGHASTNALHCVGQDGLAVQCLHVANVAANPKKVRWGFDARFEAGTYMEFDELEMTYNTSYCALQPTLSQGRLMLNEYCPNQGAPDTVEHDITAAEPINDSAGWYTFVVELDFGTKTLQGNIVKPSGESVAVGPFTLDSRFVSSAHVELHPGLDFSNKLTPAARLRTDNVWLDSQ